MGGSNFPRMVWGSNFLHWEKYNFTCSYKAYVGDIQIPEKDLFQLTLQNVWIFAS